MSYLEQMVDRSCLKVEFKINGEIISANQNIIELAGYEEPKQLIGKNYATLVSKSYLQSEEYVNFLKDLHNGKPKNGEYKLHDRDGNRFWIHAMFTPIQNEAGEWAKVLLVGHEITHLKERIRHLEVLRTTLDASFAHIEFDPYGNVLHINDNLTWLLGYDDKNELIGKHHSMFVKEGFKDSAKYKEFWEQLRANITQQGEFERVDKLGKTIWIQAAYTPVVDEHGEVVKIVKVASDITQQKIAVDQILTEQNSALMEMAAPISQLGDHVSFIPLVGFIDSHRASRIMQKVLESIGDKQTRVFILDISGVGVMDTSIANHLIRIVRASKLMGCTCIVSGISSSVAQTIVELGIDTQDILTTNDMRAAIRKAFNLAGEVRHGF